MPGYAACPTRLERDGITISARPEARLNSVSATPLVVASSARIGKMLFARKTAHHIGIAAHEQDSASMIGSRCNGLPLSPSSRLIMLRLR